MALNAIIIILAYLLGSIPSGLIVGKVFYGKDIREHGSGNLGGTNTFRTLGVKAGMAVSIADVLKGTLAASLPLLLDAEIHTLLVGIFAVIGHMYPIFAGFRGGKAVATSGGVLLAYVPVLFLFMLIFFFISLYITKYVSLSSILTGIAAFIYSLFTRDLPLILVVAVLATFVIYRHRANIKRIRNKTEPKITWL
ncbi:glycerol-3-phosphate 1-O-acyltransferase PlsY [Mesobacillus sp. AQ2]|jgi:acyl phosphate:glycerol-3-phosphate acyltransferase|uniref:glycerol-3-phosphate 1-O-acyltransferase PlsY n=1 Tax=Bacillaceae TaxID=186817 RepID=UPI0011A5633E|nr:MULTISPECIES: glycerol-3-phosphate 1-O-acyltransferase PlsY [Bacillaceae]MCM3121656.1 glycerol-3-phosphate 1-O-acyltransferase PlsY [Mesobacillus sp. MER 33]MCM3231620.1 glycerol-3-phosphate 1-O-acyltransferase PlsY [Mesobacillus sp. MER 48]WHX38591.1 glycerol-3-phosphate 1-O-acyltransferase PlsY [Mesobacillus sp. AQ2]